jgi:hypothetical protein
MSSKPDFARECARLLEVAILSRHLDFLPDELFQGNKIESRGGNDNLWMTLKSLKIVCRP